MKVVLWVSPVDTHSTETIAATLAHAWQVAAPSAEIEIRPALAGEPPAGLEAVALAAHADIDILALDTWASASASTVYADLTRDLSALASVCAMAGEYASIVLTLPALVDTPQWGADLLENLSDARAVTVLYEREQPLLGPSGLGATLARRHPELSAFYQEKSRHCTAAVGPYEAAASSTLFIGESGANARRSLRPWSGIGGGAGFALDYAGARFYRAGQWVVGQYGRDDDVDLHVAVVPDIDSDIPSIVTAVSAHAEQTGVPFVVITDSAGMKKGERPRLGIHGIYEVRPQRFWGEDGGDYLQALAAKAEGIARTWDFE